MQEAGMISEPDAVKSEQSEKVVRPQQLRRMELPPSSASDERVPARQVPARYYSGSTAYGPTVDAMQSLF